jgi:hypothetical protein
LSSATFQPRAGSLPGTFLFPVTWRCLATAAPREGGAALLPAPGSFRFAVSSAYLNESVLPSNPPCYQELFQKPAPEQQPPATRPRTRAKLTKRILEAAGLAADGRTGFRPPRKPHASAAPAPPARAAAAATSAAPLPVPAPPPVIAAPVADPPGSPEAPLRWQMFVPKSDRRPGLRAAPAALPPAAQRSGE